MGAPKERSSSRGRSGRATSLGGGKIRSGHKVHGFKEKENRARSRSRDPNRKKKFVEYNTVRFLPSLCDSDGSSQLAHGLIISFHFSRSTKKAGVIIIRIFNWQRRKTSAVDGRSYMKYAPSAWKRRPATAMISRSRAAAVCAPRPRRWSNLKLLLRLGGRARRSGTYSRVARVISRRSTMMTIAV